MIIVLELSNKASDKDVLVFAYIIGLKSMTKVKFYFNKLADFLKLSKLQRELMQHCLEEGRKGGKARNSQSSNKSSYWGIKQCQQCKVI